MFLRRSQYLAAPLLAMLLVTNDATTSLGVASGRLIGRILVDGKSVGKTRAFVQSLGCYYVPDKERRPGFGSYRGGPQASMWVTTNRYGVFHFVLPVVPQYGSGEERPEKSQLLLNVSVWVPEKGASHPFGVLVEHGRNTRASFRLVQTGEVSGRVFDDRGAVRESVAVSLAAENTPCLAPNPASWINDWSIGAMSDREGRFHFDGQVPGEYTLTAWSRSGLTLWVSNFNSDAADSNSRENLAGGFSLDLSQPLPEHIDIQLQQTGTLVFDVREKPHGRPLKYIYWGFHRPGESRLPDSLNASRWDRQLRLPCRTHGDDPAGRYVVSVLDVGSSTPAVTDVVALQTNAGMQDFKITLPATSR